MKQLQGQQVLDTWYGKTSSELSAATKEKISDESSKKSRGSSNQMPLFLNLRRANGELPDASWETDGVSLGAYSMHSFGESPRVAVESHLSQILEENPLPRYFLSAKACQGILKRAERNKKELPEYLRLALEIQSKTA
nr:MULTISPECIES: hypothetical protein [unclassified Butyricicoccus]